MMLSAGSQEMTAAQKKKAKKKAKDKAKKAADSGDGEEAAHAPAKKGAKKVGCAGAAALHLSYTT